MALIEKDFEKLYQLDKDFVAGKVDASHVNTRIAIFSQVEKRMKLTIQAMALNAKYGRSRVRKDLVNMNLIGDGTAIDIDSDVEEEKVRCPGKAYKLITRERCLDFSGDQKFPECERCDTGLVTKNMLLGPKK